MKNSWSVCSAILFISFTVTAHVTAIVSSPMCTDLPFLGMKVPTACGLTFNNLLHLRSRLRMTELHFLTHTPHAVAQLNHTAHLLKRRHSILKLFIGISFYLPTHIQYLNKFIKTTNKLRGLKYAASYTD
jgi:hypothetical protein